MNYPLAMNLTVTNAAQAAGGTDLLRNLPASDPVAAQKGPAISPEVQKRYDALLMQRADANAMPTGGAFGMNSLIRDGAIQSANKQITALQQEFAGLGSKAGAGVAAPAAQPDPGQAPTFSRFTLSAYSYPVEQREDPISRSLALESDDSDDNDDAAVSLGQSKGREVSVGQFGIELTFETPNSDKPTTQAVAAPAAEPAAPAAPAAKTPSTEEQAKVASGTLAAYMHASGLNMVNVNTLYLLANNAFGKPPADVQKAAAFMLEHADVYKTIETNDVSGADGISGVNNFDKMAQGLIAIKGATGSTTTAAIDADLAQSAKNASGTLAAYLGTNGGSIDPNLLYSLVSGNDKKVPKDVEKAAAFMLDHSDVFKALETNDVAGVDGLSGVGNLRNAAQGLIAFDAAVKKT